MDDHEDGGLSDQIGEIIDDLEEPAAGIARLVSHTEDVESLSPAQRAIWNSQIMPLLRANAERRERAANQWKADGIKD